MNDIIYGTWIPPYSGYEPPKLKWWQNILYTIYNIREVLFGILLFVIWVGLIVLCIKTKHYKWLPGCPIGLIVGVLLGMRK